MAASDQSTGSTSSSSSSNGSSSDNNSSNTSGSNSRSRSSENSDNDAMDKEKEENEMLNDESDEDEEVDNESDEQEMNEDDENEEDNEGEDDEDDEQEEDEEEDVEEDEEEEAEQHKSKTSNSTRLPSTVTPTLSKSWSILQAQAPLYTGGKVALLSHASPSSLSSSSSSSSLLLLPVNGNVAIVDLETASYRGMLRKRRQEQQQKQPTQHNLKNKYEEEFDDDGDEYGGGGVDDDDEDDHDPDAITAFCCNPIVTKTKKNAVRMIVTCSHNSILRQYNLTTTSSTADTSTHNNNKNWSISLHKTWGKSGHTLPVTCMAMHDQFYFVATGSLDGSVRIWDARGGGGSTTGGGGFVTHAFPRPTSSTTTSSGSSGGVSCVAWKNNTKELILAIGREDGSIALHDLLATTTSSSAALPIALLHDHVSAVTCLAWSAFNPLQNQLQVEQSQSQPMPILLSAGRDAVINLWVPSASSFSLSNSNTTTTITKKQKHKKRGSTSKSSWLSSFHCVHTLPIYEQVEGLVVLQSNNSYYSHNTYFDGGGDDLHNIMLATAGSKGVVRLWKVSSTSSSLSSSTTPTTQQQSQQLHLRIEPVMVQLPTSSSTSSTPPSNTTSTTTTTAGYCTMVYDPWNSSLIVAEAAEHNLHWLEETSLQTLRTLVGHWDDILDLRILPTTAQTTQTMLPLSNSSQERNVPNNNNVNESSAAVRVAVATNSSEIRLMTQGGSNKTSSSSSSLAFCGNSGGGGGGGGGSGVLKGHTGTVLCLDVSPCGRLLASCGKDRQVRLWNVQPQESSSLQSSSSSSSSCVAVAVGHTEAVGAVAFSQQLAPYLNTNTGAFVVSVSGDRTLKRWNLPNFNKLLQRHNNEKDLQQQQEQPQPLSVAATIRAHDKDINMVTVAPNDSLVATASQDKTVKLWMMTRTTKASMTATNANNPSSSTSSSFYFQLKATLKGHRRGVWDVQFSPVDRVVATASGDKTLKLWSLTDYSCVRTFQGHVSSVLRVRFLSCGLQLVSSGADGLIKLWTIRTNECETTLENGHYGKVWALDINSKSSGTSSSSNDHPLMVSGGSDSRLVFWRDTTVQEAQAKLQEQEDAILLDQKLANHLRHKEYSQALQIALQRDKPLQVFKILSSIIEADLEKGNNGVDAMQKQVNLWSAVQVVQILRYCREWNTRARNCHVAMVVCKAIVSTIPLATLATMDGGSVPEILAGILVYSERHFERLDRLHTSSYLLDLVLSGMGSLDTDDTIITDFAEWEQTSKLVLPPKQVDGRIQIGGSAVVGRLAAAAGDMEDSDQSVVTVGDSSESSSEDESLDS